MSTREKRLLMILGAFACIGELDQAEAEFKKALKADSKFRQAQFNLALVAKSRYHSAITGWIWSGQQQSSGKRKLTLQLHITFEEHRRIAM